MDNKEELLNRFYSAFQRLDYKTMQDCYSEDPVFSDPVFGLLKGNQVRAMWEMLITKGKDLQLEFMNVEADESTGSAAWIATYTFSASGNKVVNKIKAHFVFENGKIIQHKDSFDFYTWAKQALGIKGALFGWTSFMQNKVKQGARNSLVKFMRK